MEVAENKCFPGLEIGCADLPVTLDPLDNIIGMQCPLAAAQQGVAGHGEGA